MTYDGADCLNGSVMNYEDAWKKLCECYHGYLTPDDFKDAVRDLLIIYGDLTKPKPQGIQEAES